MNFLTDSIRPIYFKYLTAAFGSALRGEAAGNEKKSNEYFSAALLGTALLAALTWAGVVFFDRQLLTLFGAEEPLLPVASGAGSIWFAMPITKLVVAVFVAVRMRSVSLC